MDKKIIIGLVIALILVVGAYLIFFAPPRPVAGISLQVNPAITLTIDGQNNVIEARGLDERGEELLAGLDVINKEVPKALRIITDALHAAGLVVEGQRVLIALHPIEGRVGEPELIALTDIVYHTTNVRLIELGLVEIKIKTVVLTTELADAVRVAGLFPVDYVDLVVKVGDQAAMGILNLQRELGIDPVIFEEEFNTIGSALADMLEAGITEADALAILREALPLDPTLEELTTITAAMIDLVEKGLTKEEALARIQAAIQADPKLEEFDDLIEAPAPQPPQLPENGQEPVNRLQPEDEAIQNRQDRRQAPPAPQPDLPDEEL